ncbi:AsmA-like C-terminal region-containing protein [Chromatocurvus halotolerans]|uniref:AsmA-like protein n=1 Tax=Chromatocurvus halotolerans TaxID=1132028 RepID=A0A4R2L689_9GAMM|nr:AsmA-like C-terminal region-containing protein [Chromatocurvus halotolerans]TCO74715.1 AsmA-like protein [Chromatocurvus halotolerans]
MTRRKILLTLTTIVMIPVIIVIAGLGILYAQQDALMQRIVGQVNDRIEGVMTVDDIRLAPLKGLPYFSIDLREVNFYASRDTAQRPLYTFGDLYLGFDIRDILSNNYAIRTLKVENGHLDVVQRADGSLNLLEAKGITPSAAGDAPEEQAPLDLSINDLSIRQVDIAFSSEIDGQAIAVSLDELLARISYRQQHLYVDLLSDLTLDISAAGVPAYFTGLDVHLDIEGDYDELSGMLQVLPSTVSLNNADFRVDGGVNIANDLDMDLRLRGDKSDFSLLAAFLPPDVGEGLDRYQNAGTIFFEGTVVGKAGNGHLPAVEVQFGSEDVWFVNRQTRARVEQLGFTGSFSTGEDGTLRSSILQISNLYAKPEEGVFEGRLAIRNFVDPVVKLDVHADLDLEFLGRFLQLSELEHVRGKVLLDMNFDEIVDLNFPGESLALLKSGVDSELTIRDLQFTLPELAQTVSAMNGYAVMRDGVITLDSLSLRIGDSDLSLNGSLSDFPAMFHRYDSPVRIELTARADRIDLPDLLAVNADLATRFDEVVENASVTLALESRAQELFNFQHLPRGTFFIDDLYATFRHYPHTLHDFHADIGISEREIAVTDFSGEIDDTDFHFSGSLDNYPKWFQEDPVGDSLVEFDLTSRHFSLKDLLTYRGENYLPESYRDEVFRDTALHGRMALHYDRGLQSVDLYLDELTSQTELHPLKLENFAGRAHYEQGHLLLEDFSGALGESDFHVNLSYFFEDPEHPQTRENFLELKSEALNLDTLTGFEDSDEPVDHAQAFNVFEVPFPNLRVNADIGRMNYHNYCLEDVSLALRVQEDHYLYVDSLDLGVAGGSLSMTGYFNGSDPDNIYYHSDIDARDLDIDKLMIKFDNFGQDALVNDNVHGRITGRIESTFRMHPDLTPRLEESEAHMELTIDDGSLVNFAPLMAMSDFFGDRNLGLLRFDRIENSLDLKDGALTIPSMLINSSVGFMEVSGQQGLDASMAYFVRVPLRLVGQVAWRKLFGGGRRAEINPARIDEIEAVGDTSDVRFLNLRITGTPDDYSVTLGRKPD